MKEGRRLGGVHAGPESKVMDRHREKKKQKIKKCIPGSGRTELGGGEEHAGCPNEPGRRVRGNEGEVALRRVHFPTFFVLFDQFYFLNSRE